jgi:pimeloyl-ACP methyl ester carboxylesterase
MARMEPRDGEAFFAGYRIAYRVLGEGPAVVLVKPHRLPKDYDLLTLLSARHQVIQIEPLGFGRSERPADYPPEGIHEQVLAVLDAESVDRFVVWGYSQGGSMAAAVAQATPRVAALIVGAAPLVDRPTDAWMARMDREQRVPVAPRTFWHWFKRFDWLAELERMPCPRLVYGGTDDQHHVRHIRRHGEALTGRGVTVIEFPGLDHDTCLREPALSTQVVPEVTDWLDHNLNAGW